ncbi:hypothetical protein [Methylobacterium sp. E-066]|uniref:hypothetical protein n=1 Tax=Methylobacterium sp. E-066 TaxID=2836584 RepID=UPI001FBB6AC2|nr:hypothetical protein [Methylobacterium sp. E-066]MCJ2142565.1 hypothetical protein [Methylobacterium sp. E-066]
MMVHVARSSQGTTVVRGCAVCLSNNLLLRQTDGLRRDMRELMEREARTIELVNRIAVRMDEGFTRIRDDMAYIRRDVGEMRGDLLTMENRV